MIALTLVAFLGAEASRFYRIKGRMSATMSFTWAHHTYSFLDRLDHIFCALLFVIFYGFLDRLDRSRCFSLDRFGGSAPLPLFGLGNSGCSRFAAVLFGFFDKCRVVTPK
jgi:hypothetical protein